MRIKILLTLFSVIICSQVYGAELLVIAKDSCADPMCNRMGDVISCREDGVDWAKQGSGYSDPMWKMVKIPGMSKADCEAKYLQPLTEEVVESVDVQVDAEVYNDASKMAEYKAINRIDEVVETRAITSKVDTIYITENGGRITLDEGSSAGKIVENGIVATEDETKDVYTLAVIKKDVKTVRDRKYRVDATLVGLKAKSVTVELKDADVKIPVKSLVSEKSVIETEKAAIDAISVK